MKLKTIMLGAAMVCAFAGTAGAKEKVSNDTTVCFRVEPQMVCHNCENKVKSNLRFEKGVKKIDASAKEQRVAVTFDRRKTDVEALKKGFEKIGYEAEAISEKAPSEKCCAGSCCGNAGK